MSRPRRSPAPLERDIQSQCVAWLALIGAFPVRVNSGRLPWTDATGRRRSFAMNSQPGCADVLVCLPAARHPAGVARFAALEFKRPGNPPTELQESFLGEVRRRGGLALVVDSLECLQTALRAEGYEV